MKITKYDVIAIINWKEEKSKMAEMIIKVLVHLKNLNNFCFLIYVNSVRLEVEVEHTSCIDTYRVQQLVFQCKYSSDPQCTTMAQEIYWKLLNLEKKEEETNSEIAELQVIGYYFINNSPYTSMKTFINVKNRNIMNN